MSLADEASRARAEVLAAEAAATDAERAAMRSAATGIMRMFLTRPNGSTVTMTDVGLKPVDADLDHGLVVWTDGALHLCAQEKDGGWQVLLVESVDGRWTPRSEPLTCLADLGAALADAQ